MDLTKITGSYKELQNPQYLHFVYGGPKITFWGIYSNTTYRVNDGEVIEVDERDVDYLLSLEKHGRRYFDSVDVGVGFSKQKTDKTVVKEFTIAEPHKRKNNHVDEEYFYKEDTIEDFVEAPYDYFDTIDGIGEKLNEKIHDLGVHDFFDLYAKGIAWITDLPRINDEKANKIYKQLEELIGEYK